jgi:hypothetical protein
MNSCLSPHLNRQKASKYLAKSNKSHWILFEIDADPRLDRIGPFSNIKSFCYTGRDGEILFKVGPIFRINDIHCQQHGLTIMRITLCTDNDLKLKSIFKSLKINSKHNRITLVWLMISKEY